MNIMSNTYVPAIEDFHVGYEYWFKTIHIKSPALRNETWVKMKLADAHWLLSTKQHLEKGLIRTEFLTIQHLEEDGWEYKATMLIADYSEGGRDVSIFRLDRNDVSLYFIPDEQKIRIVKMDYSRETTSPMGFIDSISATFTCPSINELRQVCKLLGISKDESNPFRRANNLTII